MKIRNNNLLDKGTNIISIIALGFVVFISYTMSQFSALIVGVIIVFIVRKIILPESPEQSSKYVREAVVAYPMLDFSAPERPGGPSMF